MKILPQVGDESAEASQIAVSASLEGIRATLVPQDAADAFPGPRGYVVRNRTQDVEKASIERPLFLWIPC
jgi:hypothetical protein